MRAFSASISIRVFCFPRAMPPRRGTEVISITSLPLLREDANAASLTAIVNLGVAARPKSTGGLGASEVRRVAGGAIAMTAARDPRRKALNEDFEGKDGLEPAVESDPTFGLGKSG